MNEQSQLLGHARRIAARRLSAEVSREVLFAALVDRNPGCGLTSQRLAALYCVENGVELLMDASPLPFLPAELAADDAIISEDARRIVEENRDSEWYLLRLLETETTGEFDWFFDSVAELRYETGPSVLKEWAVGSQFAGFFEAIDLRRWTRIPDPRKRAQAAREYLKGTLKRMVGHPDYPFAEIAVRIRSGDKVAAKRAMADADLTIFLLHKQGLGADEIMATAGPP